MPRTRFDRFSDIKRDPVKGLVLEYMSLQKINGREIAENIGISRATFSRRMAEHSDEWHIKDVKAICKFLKIPREELVKAIRS